MRRLILVTVVLGALLVAPAVSNAACGVKPKHVVFAEGTGPNGETWSAEAGIKKNGTCPSWLFQVGFRFSGGFNWGSGTEIPVGGHTEPRADISGTVGPISREADEGAAFGYVGAEVTMIRLKMSDGTSVEIHPKFPPERLRKKFVWMRGIRYFVAWYPGHGYLKEDWAFNKAGTLIHRNLHAEGDFF
jgi:hypothetical protein